MHNQRKDVAKLFGYLMEDNHLYNDSFIEKEIVYKWIFPKEAYDDAKIRQTMYFTTKCLEEFFIYQSLREDEVRARNALGSVFRKRNLHKAFNKNLRETLKLQKKQSYRNGQYLLNDYHIQREKYAFLVGVKRMGLDLQRMTDTLDVMYLADKLRISCAILAHQSVYKKEEYHIELLEEVLEKVKTKDYLDYPAIAIYFYGYMAQIEKEDESHFFNLKEEIMQNGHLFPKSEMQDFYLMAINYCVGRINAGVQHYLREAFEFYRLGLEQRVLLDQGVLSRYTFINVLFTRRR